MKRDLIGSAAAHALLFVILGIVSTTGASLPPPLSPDDVMMVTPVDALPQGMADIPVTQVPGQAEDLVVAESPDLSVEAPEAIPIEPKKPEADNEPPKPRAETKPPVKPAVTKPVAKPTPEELAAADDSTADDGVYESTLQKGSDGRPGGSLLGMPGGKPGGRAGSYPDRITNKIYQYWKNPVKLPREVSCSVVFRVSPGGKASQIALESSSGMPAYDQSTIRAIYEATPYPPFPRSLKDEYIVMRVTFQYIP